jgi:hypothetical protein
MHLTRAELCAVLNQITAILWKLPEGSPARHATLAILANIRCVHARRDPLPEWSRRNTFGRTILMIFAISL